jgi:hypothetical protein
MKTIHLLLSALGFSVFIGGCAMESEPPEQRGDDVKLGEVKSSLEEGCQSACSISCGGQTCSARAGANQCAQCLCTNNEPSCSTIVKGGGGFEIMLEASAF